MTVVIQKGKPPADRLRQSLVSQVASRIFQIVLSIGIGGWTARYLGPTALGKLSYVASLVGILAPVGNLGIKDSLTGLLCVEKPLPNLVGTAFFIQLTGTAIVSTVLIAFAISSRDPIVAPLIYMAIIGSLFNSAEVMEVKLLNDHRGTLLARLGFLQALVGAMLSTAALLMQAPLLAFGALPVLQSIAKSFLLFRSSSFVLTRHWLTYISVASAKKLIARGLPLMLSGFAIVIYMKSDQLMLEWLRSSGDVGQYSVAVRVAETTYFLPMVLSQTFTPRLRPEGEQGRPRHQVVSQLYRIAWLLGVAISVATAVILPPILLLVFGSQYEHSVIALQLLAPSAFAVAMGCASSAWLNVSGYVGHIAHRTALGAISNVIINLWLIPPLGIAGAAIATSCSQLLSVFVFGLADPKTRDNSVSLLFPFVRFVGTG